MILYADRITGSMERAMAETDRRRDQAAGLQRRARHHARRRSAATSPTSSATSSSRDQVTVDTGIEDRAAHGRPQSARLYRGSRKEDAQAAAADLEFETAGRLRDEIRKLEADELGLPPSEPSRAPVRGNSTLGKPGTRQTRYGKAKAARAAKRGV